MGARRRARAPSKRVKESAVTNLNPDESRDPLRRELNPNDLCD